VRVRCLVCSKYNTEQKYTNMHPPFIYFNAANNERGLSSHSCAVSPVAVASAARAGAVRPAVQGVKSIKAKYEEFLLPYKSSSRLMFVCYGAWVSL
jgi:hypothetical protein